MKMDKKEGEMKTGKIDEFRMSFKTSKGGINGKLRFGLLGIIAISIILGIFISATAFNLIFDASSGGFFNQTITSAQGVGLTRNATDYNATQGDYSSFVFYNSTQTYWNTTLGIATKNMTNSTITILGTNVTLQTRTANNYNLTDPSLVSFWSFNNDNSTTAFDELGKNNGTLNGAMSIASDANGAVGKGYYFDGGNDQINLQGAVITNPTNLTISAWIKTTKNDGVGDIFNQINNPADYEIRLELNLGRAFFTLYKGGYYTTGSNVFVANGNWHYMVGVLNSTGTSLYVDGVLILTGSVPSSPMTNFDMATIGSFRYSGGSFSYFNGAIDEVRVYNRSLSASEVADLYNLGATHISDWSAWSAGANVQDGVGVLNSSQFGKFMQFKTELNTNDTSVSPYVVNHTITNPAPSINIVYPLANAYYSVGPNASNYTALEGPYPLSVCWLFNQTANSSFVTPGTNFTGVNSSEGTNTWVVYCNDTNANTFSSPSVSFTVDLTNPQISFSGGTAGDYANLSQNFVYANVSFTETNFANITFRLYNDTTTVNTTTFTSATYNMNWTNLPSKNYSYQVNITDLANNKNATSLRHILIDITAPNATLLSPANNSYLTIAAQNFAYLYNATYSASTFGIFNNTNATASGIGLAGNNLTGDYQSYVFYNTAASYWSAILGTANITTTKNITAQYRLANNYNISDPSLVSFWSFNNDNSTTVFDELGRNNGTRQGSIANANDGNGTVGKGYYFDGLNDVLQIADDNSLDISTIQNMTISAWTITDGTTTRVIMQKGYTYASNWWGNYDFLVNFNKLYLGYEVSGGQDGVSSTNTIPINTWTHAVVVVDNSIDKAYFYINGQLAGSPSMPAGFGLTNNQPLMIGIRPDGWSPFGGALDEVRIYNRSLSASEVLDLYNLGATHISDWGAWSSETTLQNSTMINTTATGKFMQFKSNFNSDSAGVTPYLTNHSAGFSSIPPNSATYNLTANLSDDFSGIKNATLWIYNQSGLYNQTSITGYAAGTLTATVGVLVTFIDGVYKWFYSLFDFVGNAFTTGNYTLTIDATYPLIDWGVGTAGDYANLSQNFVYANVSFTETNFANITFSLYNNTATVNSTTFTSATYSINWTNLPNNNYFYQANITDLASNKNATSLRHILIDITAPNATLNAPANNSYLNNATQNLTANLSDDFGIKNATLYVYNSSGLYNQTSITGYAAGTLTATAGVIVQFVDGIYKWFWNAFDFAGNLFTTGNYTLTIDSTNPAINFTDPTPANDSGRGGVFEINVSITELNLGNVSITFNNTIEARCNRSSSSLSNVFSCNNANATIYNTSSSEWIFLYNRTGLVVGITYYYNVTAYDFALNSNTTETRTVKGNTAPVLNFTTPTTAIGNYSMYDIIANLTCTDNEANMNITQVYLFYRNLWSNNTLTLINLTTLTNSASNNIYLNYSNLSEGIYYLNATAGDTVGETSNTSTRVIVLDRTNPNITLNTPVNGTIANNQTQNLTANISENLGIQNATLFVYNLTGLFNQTSITGYAVGTLTATAGIVIQFVDGIYNWFWNTFDWAGNLFTSENSTLTVDIIAPTISGIVYSPNTTALLDPSVILLINASLVDSTSRVNSVVLEFYNSSNWVNYTMTRNSGNSSSGNYNASVTLESSDNSYAFNIWYNDSAGNSNHSVNQTFSANWDCTWSIATTGGLSSTNNPEGTGGFYQEKILGNVTITNTGDVQYTNNCSIRFARTAGGAEFSQLVGLNFSDTYINTYISTPDSFLLSKAGLRYYYNSAEVTTLTVNASSNKTLEIKGMFPKTTTILLEYPYFTIVSSINNTETGTNNVIITSKMVITPGAYLETAFSPSSQTVYLTPGNFYVAGYAQDLVDAVDNPQNNTAYNVNLNISLSSTLNSLYASGNLNKTISVLNNTNKNYSNLTFTLTSANIVSIVPGSYSLTSFTSGYENSTGNLSLIVHANNQTILNSTGAVTFACYSVKDTICVDTCINTTAGLVYDPDCSLPSTTVTVSSSSGGGGGGGGTALTKFVKSEAVFELVRGAKQEFSFSLDNKYPYAKKNLELTITGLNAEYLQISPLSIDSIMPGESKDIVIKINAPAYFTGKKYDLILKITGFLDSNGTLSPFVEQRYLTLYITEIPRLEADNDMNSSFDMILEMNNSGMVITEISQLYETMKKAYDEVSFAELKNLYEQISTIYKNALEAKAIIDELTLSIAEKEKAGTDVTETKKTLYIAENAFKRGDYALALQKLKEARLMFAVETKGEFNLAYAIKNKPLESFGILIGLGLFGLGSSLLIRYRIYTRKLRLLGEEEVLLLELMKVVQREYFEKNHMSMEEYGEAMRQYERKLGETIENKIRIETKLTNLLKLKGKWNALDQEKKKLISLMKQTQEDYLVKGKIEIRVYENMLKTYSSRLGEVEEEIAFLEAQEALKNEMKLRRMFKA